MTTRSTLALVLAGGGVAGAVYEIGALRALDALMLDVTVNDFDLYVGTSAGALVCSGLASGIHSDELLEITTKALDVDGELSPGRLFSPRLMNLLRNSPRLSAIVAKRISYYLRNPRHFSPVDLAWDLMEVLPPGIYGSGNLARFVESVQPPEIQNSFHRLARKLYVIATDLDSGERAVFGMPPLEDVPISQAIAASTAVPLLFEPVTINGVSYVDGGLRGHVSLDIAIEHGAKLIVCINPLVPFDNSNSALGHRLSEGGSQAVLNQSYRTLFYAGLHYHLKNLRRRHPDVDIVLIEPHRDDTLVFEDPILRFHPREELMQHAYESVMQTLCNNYEHYASILAKHGYYMRSRHDLPMSLQDAPPSSRMRRLRSALSKLEHTLDELGPSAA